MKKVLIKSAMILSLALAAPSPTQAIVYQGIRFHVPGATETVAYDINNVGQIVGEFIDASGVIHGFLKDGDTFTMIDVPGATRTHAFGINDVGQIVGEFFDATGGIHGFLKDGATLTTFDVPGGARARAINNAGHIVGLASGLGFLKVGDDVTFFAVPGASSTGAFGINEAGQIVGNFFVDGTIHGFLKEGSSFTTIDAPGAVRVTQAFAINNLGQILGDFETASTSHMYLKDGPTFFDISIQFVGGGGGGDARGINDAGQIVGRTGAGGPAFVATPVPEGGSLILLTSGLVVLAGVAWRRPRAPLSGQAWDVSEMNSRSRALSAVTKA